MSKDSYDIVFSSIRVTNFMSVSTNLVFRLSPFSSSSEKSSRPNLSLVLGHNNDSSGSDNNGSGKSALFEAIYWALYGETVRQKVFGLPVDHVLPVNLERGARTEVTLELLYRGKETVITRWRSKSGNGLTVRTSDGKSWDNLKVAQEFIDDMMGISPVQFCNLVYLSGSYPKLFARASDAQRKEIIQELFSLCNFADVQEYIFSCIKEWESELTQRNKEIYAAKAKLELDIKETDRIKTQGKNLNAEYKRCLKDLKIEMANLEDVSTRLKQVEEEYAAVEDAPSSEELTVLEEAWEEKKEAFDKGVKEGKSRLDSAYDQFEKAYKSLKEVDTKIRIVESRIKDMQTQIDSTENLDGQRCPTCFMVVDSSDAEAHFSDLMKDQEEERSQLQKELKDAEVVADKQEKEVEVIKSKNAKLEQDFCQEQKEYEKEKKALMEKLNEKRIKLRSQLSDIRSEEKQGVGLVSRLKSQADQLKKNLHQMKEEYKNYQERKQKHLQQIDRFQKDIGVFESDIKDYKFWKEGFGDRGIPSLYVEVLLPELTRVIQKYVDILSGGDVVLRLKAYKETKSKTIQEKIQVEAINAQGADVYGGNSAGERSRIDLALTLGLCEFFRKMGVFSTNILVCDEVFDAMDASGVEYAREAFLAGGHENIFVILHEKVSRELFDSIVMVTKQRGVSKAKCYSVN